MSKQTDIFEIVKPELNEIPDKKIPKDIHLKSGQLYCPHCSNVGAFKRDKKLGVGRCPYCGVSERDYNVKLVNSRWR